MGGRKQKCKIGHRLHNRPRAEVDVNTITPRRSWIKNNATSLLTLFVAIITLFVAIITLKVACESNELARRSNELMERIHKAEKENIDKTLY